MSSAVPAAQYYSFGMITVGVDGGYKPDWYLILYYIVCLSIMASLCGWLWNKGQQVAALVTGVLLIFVFIYFDYRWFPVKDTGASKCPGKDASGNDVTEWPPIINMCPDYFVGWTDPLGNIYCYDAHNTYGMQTYNGARLTTGLSINGASGQSAYLTVAAGNTVAPTVSAAAATPGAFPLYTIFKNESVDITADTVGQYLRWEGVWDGRELRADNILRGMPYPRGS